jgi:hypothetical protein
LAADLIGDVQERLAPASIRIGTVLLALGLAGGVVLWILR